MSTRECETCLHNAKGMAYMPPCSHCQDYSCWAENPEPSELERLKEFARPVIRQECWSIFPQDGGDIQELAEKLGLIEPRIATADDVDDESDYGVGDTFFVFSDVLKESDHGV